jgi:hypothetical protein
LLLLLLWWLGQATQGMGENNAVLKRRGAVSRELFVAMAAAYKAMHGKADGSVPASFQVSHTTSVGTCDTPVVLLLLWLAGGSGIWRGAAHHQRLFCVELAARSDVLQGVLLPVTASHAAARATLLRTALCHR